MATGASKALTAGLVAVAVVLMVLAPCRCVVDAASCHRTVEEPDAHGCCEKPAGVQAVDDTCCDDGPELAVTSPEAPGVTPAAQRGAPVAFTAAASVHVVPSHSPPPLRTDRHTVLLI